MVRLQVFCLLIGTFAFLSVRKQKVVTSTLFDQRKRRVSGIMPDRQSIDVEMTSNLPQVAASREETVPLTKLEVV
jgi:hypothetical protein